MAHKGKNRQATKNQKERQAYGRDVRRSNQMNPTGTYGAENLRGSDDFHYYNNNNYDDSEPDTAKMSIVTWIQRNKMKVLGGIVTLIIIPVFGFAIKWIFDQNAVIQVLNYRMEQIELAVESLDDDLLTKEVLDLKLELARSDMQALIPDLSGIQEQLDDIEERLLAVEEAAAAVE